MWSKGYRFTSPLSPCPGLLEVVFVVATDIPLVAPVGLDQFSLRSHVVCSSLIALDSELGETRQVVQQVDGPNASRSQVCG